LFYVVYSADIIKIYYIVSIFIFVFLPFLFHQPTPKTKKNNVCGGRVFFFFVFAPCGGFCFYDDEEKGKKEKKV
jgi:hypothetical protein